MAAPRVDGLSIDRFSPNRFSLGRFSITLAPATQSVLVQLVALLVVFSSVVIVNYFTPVNFSVFYLVLMQASSAAGLCMLIGLAVWWRWIHFCFPLVMLLMSMWQLPNEIYLIGFVVTLSVFWTTFRSQVPFFPSRPVVWKKVAELISQQQQTRVVEIGSGLGDLSMYIAKNRKNSQVEGVEIAPLPWLVSTLRSWVTRSSARFKLGDYRELDFAQYDLVFAYLSPAAMSDLWKKAQQEMRAGSLLVSYEFEIPGVPPSFSITNGDKTPTIFVWKM